MDHAASFLELGQIVLQNVMVFDLFQPFLQQVTQTKAYI
jgi:hypothetical protein